MKRLLGLGVLMIVVAACGSDSSSSTAPSASSTAQVAGVWRGTFTQASVSGGECLGPIFLAGNGSVAQVSVAFQQSASTISAIATATASGSTISMGGSVGQSAVTMNWTACSSCAISGIRCSSTIARDIRMQTASFNGTVTGSTMTGTETETYNVTAAGTTAAVAIMTISNNVALTRQ